MPTETRKHVGWAEVGAFVSALVERWRPGLSGIGSIYGVPRGGLIPAVMVAERMGLPMTLMVRDDTLVVDDLVDSGATMGKFLGHGIGFDALVRKPHSPHPMDGLPTLDGWLVFPWEVGTADETGPADAVVRLLEYIGEDPTREGLLKTPDRVIRSLSEMTAGYHEDPAAILATTFDETSDEMVILRDVEFTSLCEHHLLPFTGTVSLGYVPASRVVGLSKLARLVECFARRLQVQERMTSQIASAVETELGALGVGVIVRARHACMGCRGIRKPTAEMVTSAMLGVLRTEASARAEFLHLTDPR